MNIRYLTPPSLSLSDTNPHACSWEKWKKNIEQIAKRRKLQARDRERVLASAANIRNETRGSKPDNHENYPSTSAEAEKALLHRKLSDLQKEFKSSISASELLMEKHQVVFPVHVTEPLAQIKDCLANEAIVRLLASGDLSSKDAIDTSKPKPSAGNPPWGQDADMIYDLYKQALLMDCLISKRLLRRLERNDSDPIPHALVEALFLTASYSSDDFLSAAACQSLMKLFRYNPSNPGDDASTWMVQLHSCHRRPLPHILSHGKKLSAGFDSTVLPPNLLPPLNPTMLLQALRSNGCRSCIVDGSQHSSLGHGSTPIPETKKISNDAAESSPREEIRLHSLKLILKIVVSICHYYHVWKKQQDTAALPPLHAWSLWENEVETLYQLIETIFRLYMDPCCMILEHEIQASMTALLSVFEDDQWRSHALSSIAPRVANIGPSTVASLSIVLNMVPDGIYHGDEYHRARQLQQHASYYIFKDVTQADAAASIGSLAVGKKDWYRKSDERVPIWMISSQPWFENPSMFLSKESLEESNTSQDMKNHSNVFNAELFLMICHMLLWPLALATLREKHDDGCGLSQEDSIGDVSDEMDRTVPYLDETFLKSWYRFLIAIKRSIKGLNPVMAGLKALASRLECQYQEILGH